MGGHTQRLGLYITDMQTDGNHFFDFDRDLNQNFIKIDEFAGTIIKIGTPQLTLDFNMTLPDNCVWLEGATDWIPSDEHNPDFPKLYQIYGTQYNDEQTPTGKYKLPDFRNRAIYGATTSGYLHSQVPNITASFAGVNNGTAGGACVISANYGGDLFDRHDSGGWGHVMVTDFNAVRCSSVYKDGISTVQTEGLKVRVYTRFE